VKFGIIGNTRKPAVIDVVKKLVSWFKKNKIEFLVDRDLADLLKKRGIRVPSVTAERMGTRCDMVFSLGGDGTILWTADKIGKSETPILGINIGRLGFLTEVDSDTLIDNIRDLLEKQYYLENRMLLEAWVLPKKKHAIFSAVNDVVISKGSHARTIEINVFIDNVFFNNYVADGIIISTPTGSTAYNLSSGGPILLPTINDILINPLCPHSLSARPVVIASTSKVLVQVQSPDVKAEMFVDGKTVAQLDDRDKITVQKAPYFLRLVRCNKSSFFDVLREKLNWGESLNRAGE